MAWVVILSEEEKILFSFDEKCLYINEKPCDKKLEGLPFYVFKYLVDNSPHFKTCDEIFQNVWVLELGKNRPVNDASIRDKITIIRKYLGDTTEPYKYIETSDGSYRSTKKGKRSENPEDEASGHKKNQTNDNSYPREKEPISSQDNSTDADVIRVASRLIHFRDRKHPKINAEMELEIRDIIDDLEQGIYEDFFSISSQLWKDFDKRKKAQIIAELYIKFSDESFDLSMEDTNARL